MKRSSRGSERGKSKPRVRNRLIIGDSKPAYMVRPSAHQSIASTTVTRSNKKRLNKQIKALDRPIKLYDGSTLKREIRPKSDRAKAVYGSRKKAMRKAYMSDGTGTNKKRKARTTRGSMKLKPRDTNTSGTNSIGQVFSPERPRSRRRKRTLI